MVSWITGSRSRGTSEIPIALLYRVPVPDACECSGRTAHPPQRSKCSAYPSSASPPRWAESRRSSWRWCSYYALVACSPACAQCSPKFDRAGLISLGLFVRGDARCDTPIGLRSVREPVVLRRVDEPFDLLGVGPNLLLHRLLRTPGCLINRPLDRRFPNNYQSRLALL